MPKKPQRTFVTYNVEEVYSDIALMTKVVRVLETSPLLSARDRERLCDLANQVTVNDLRQMLAHVRQTNKAE